eukprot:170431-Chlamydomonas_euryale.AAC.2
MRATDAVVWCCVAQTLGVDKDALDRQVEEKAEAEAAARAEEKHTRNAHALMDAWLAWTHACMHACMRVRMARTGTCVATCMRMRSSEACTRLRRAHMQRGCACRAGTESMHPALAGGSQHAGKPVVSSVVICVSSDVWIWVAYAVQPILLIVCGEASGILLLHTVLTPLTSIPLSCVRGARRVANAAG